MYTEPYLLAAVVAFFVILAICSEIRARRWKRAAAEALKIQFEWQMKGYFHAHRLLNEGVGRKEVLLLVSSDNNPYFVHGVLQRLDDERAT